MKQSNGSSIPVKVLRYLLMAFVLVISLYPILWVLLNSFKQTPGGLGLPEKWVFDGYITIFTKLNIGQYFLNSLIVTVISTVISVFLEGRGFLHVGTWQFSEAKHLIDRIAANNWRIPTGIVPKEYKPEGGAFDWSENSI